MSESISKRGPKRRLTDSERKGRKRESNAKLSKNMIWIGVQCDRWNELRSVLRVKTNAEVAKKMWTGKCNVYVLTMKINRTLWLIEVIILFRSEYIEGNIYLVIIYILNVCYLLRSR